MTVSFPEIVLMPAKKRTEKKTKRVELIAEPSLVKRIDEQATRHGLGRSAYVRQACIKQLEKDEADAPEKGTKS